MLERCYKKLAEELGVNEYKILIDLYRIFYKDKQFTKDLYDSKKISRETYDYIMKTFPKKKGTNRIFETPDGDLPSEIYFEDVGLIALEWKINGKRGRNNDLPSFVLYSNTSKNKNNYEMRYTWSKNGKKGRDGNKPCIVAHFYIDDLKTDKVEESWLDGKHQRRITTDDEKIVEEWLHYDFGEFYRLNDLPARITTFKKTGKQRLEWYSQKITASNNSSDGNCRENDKPCVIDEDGTQIWSLCKYNTGFGIYEVEDEYYKKYPDLFIGREGGKPAVIKADGTQMWYHNGVKHRDDKPAVIYPDGTEMWYHNGVKHRSGNPAVIYPNGKEEWWTNGVKREERDILKSKLKNDDVVDKIMRMI
jgi:hypothetical protein